MQCKYKHFMVFQVLVLHYESVKSDLVSNLRRVVRFLHLPVDQKRLECMAKYRNGFFRRLKDDNVSQESMPNSHFTHRTL